MRWHDRQLAATCFVTLAYLFCWFKYAEIGSDLVSWLAMPGSLGDWVGIANILSLGVALAGFWLVLRQLRLQANSADSQALFTISSGLDRAWTNFQFGIFTPATPPQVDEKKWLYFLTELLGEYESACHIYNHRLISARASALLHQRIANGLPSLLNDPAVQQAMDRMVQEKPAKKRGGMFREIKQFSRVSA